MAGGRALGCELATLSLLGCDSSAGGHSSRCDTIDSVVAATKKRLDGNSYAGRRESNRCLLGAPSLPRLAGESKFAHWCGLGRCRAGPPVRSPACLFGGARRVAGRRGIRVSVSVSEHVLWVINQLR